MILATAGHIDHGKTALIRALTGIDADRLPEEKRRGMTIDLGFASAALPDGSEIGFVDVPGHERFLPNMLAGVLSIDRVLLVVAAGQCRIGKAEIDCHAAPLFFGQAIGVDPGQRPDERGLAVVDMPGGREDHAATPPVSAVARRCKR